MMFISGTGRYRRSFRRNIYIVSFSLIASTLPFICYSATSEVSGLIEAEMSFADNFENESSSDITLATVEIGVDTEISEWFSGHALLLHEEGETDLEIDEGYIQYGNSFLSPFFVQAGRIYVPFGKYETNMISDPLTLEIGETRESAIALTYDQGIVISAYLFNGELLETGGDDTLDNFGVMLGYIYRGDAFLLDFGFGYINNLGESDALGEVIIDNLGDSAVHYVAGFAGHLFVQWGSFQFIGELVAANDEFNTGEVQSFRKSKPSATNVEFAYAVSDNINMALGFQNTVDMARVKDLPESRFLLGLSYQINEATAIAFEYASDSDYSIRDGGTGGSASITTLQLAMEF